MSARDVVSSYKLDLCRLPRTVQKFAVLRFLRVVHVRLVAVCLRHVVLQ